MNYKSAKGISGWGLLGILFGFIGVGLILAGLVQFAIGFSLINANTPLSQKGDAMMKALFKPENALWLQISQVVGTLFLMFLPTVAYSLIGYGKNKLWLGFSNHINARQVILGFFIIFCANIVSQPVEEVCKFIIGHFPHFNNWAKSLEDTYNDQVAAMTNLKSWPAFILAIFIMAFFPAMFEEMLFRGALQSLFINWWKKPILAIVVTSFVFSFIHGSAYLLLSRAILGFALGYMYYLSKNLWVNIIAHFLNNAVAVTQMFIISRSNIKPNPSQLDDHFPIWLELIAIVVFYFLFVLFKRSSAGNKAKVETDLQKLWIQSTPQYNLTDNHPHII